MRSHSYWLPALAIAAGSLLGTAALAAEASKDAIFAGKFEVNGKVIQGVDVGRNGGFALIYEEDTTAAGGSDHQMHCLGVMQGTQGTAERIVEQHGYCVETDKDGDKVLWKVTPEANHSVNVQSLPGTAEALDGTGKYHGISKTIKSTCNVTVPGPNYVLSCEMMP